ncbi:uncharacterized protein LOC130979289 [Arachis stenosperma]|uniref:uncharacterized protein LOC130979289 n=2 Tax=Arachis stenosperma TaxID=217475 RepID=UPI0025AC227A|nr:uncharacterized protein LOC130979289 [Arachis stenosperma]
MEFTSHVDQSYYMGYCPPPQNDSCHYPHGGWEYQQEMMDHEQSTQMGHAPRSHNDQASYMGYFSPPQNDSSYYTNCGWENQDQGMMGFEQSNQMGYFPRTQNDSYSYEWDNYPNCDWEGQNQREFNISYPIHQEPSPLNYPTSSPNFSYQNSSPLEFASTQNSFQNPYNSIHQPQNSFHYTENSFQNSQNSFHNSQNSFHTPQNDFTTTHPYPQNYSQPSSLELIVEDHLQWSREILESWKEQEILCKKIDGHLEQIRKHFGLPSSEDEDQFVGEEVEKEEQKVHVSSEISMKNEVIENEIELEVIKEHEHSQPSQTSLEFVIEKYEEEMKKSWEDQQTSSIEELLKQMFSVKEELEEQEKEAPIPSKIPMKNEVVREENNQGSPHSNEVESCMEDDLIEPSIQEVLDEEDTPTITQHLSLEIKEVKAINKNIQRRIVTKKQKTTSMKKRRSTKSNPTPTPNKQEESS